MNIFIMMLVALFMGTYYLISSPSLRIREQEIDYAVTRADLRSIAECTMAAHNATINGHTFDDECVEKKRYQKPGYMYGFQEFYHHM